MVDFFFLVVYLEVLEEIDQLPLMRLQIHLSRKLVNAQLFDYLENVELFV